MRITKRLTARKCTKLKPKPGQKHTDYPDGGNLYLHTAFTDNGKGITRCWLFKYELHGERHAMGLGASDTVLLAEAREEARLLRQKLQKKIDPLAAKREREQAVLAERAKAITFEECATAYIRLHQSEWKNPRHRQQWESSLTRYAFPTLGKLAPSKIDPAAVMNAIQPHWTERCVTASRVLDRIGMVLDYAKASGYCSGDNAARAIRSALPKQSKVAKVEHHASLPYADVPGFMERLRAVDSIGARALELLVLTASRTQEVKLAQRREIDFANAMWNRPAAHMKGGEDHSVPMSPRVIELFQALGPGEPDALIFYNRSKPLGAMLFNQILARMLPGIEVTPHGFRSSFKQWAVERANYPDFVSEIALAHEEGNKVAAAYKRKAEPLEKRRRMMRDWSAYCMSAPIAVEGGNVIAIGR
jgi:integrase